MLTNNSIHIILVLRKVSYRIQQRSAPTTERATQVTREAFTRRRRAGCMVKAASLRRTPTIPVLYCTAVKTDSTCITVEKINERKLIADPPAPTCGETYRAQPGDARTRILFNEPNTRRREHLRRTLMMALPSRKCLVITPRIRILCIPREHVRMRREVWTSCRLRLKL